MKTKQRIPAFTLSEMIIVLILTSIVVGLAFSTLKLVHQHMNSIKGNFSRNTELSLLETSLWLDFNRYSSIRYNASERELKFTNNIESKTYLFDEQHIIKGLDTFNINLQSKIFFFEGETLEEGTIDAIKLSTDKTLQSQTLFVFKKNDALQFIN